jgi:hypothetical protein
MVIFLTTQTKEEQDQDFFNPPLTFKVIKLIQIEGDAKYCPTCDANTLYVTGCAVCHFQQSKS